MYEFTLEEIIARVYLYLKKYLWLYVILGILGAGIGFYKVHTQKAYYQAYIYGSTGLIYSPRSADYQINALVADLKTVSTNISNQAWVKENFNIDSASFKSMSVILEKSNFLRVSLPVKISLKAYSPDDFEKFKAGLEYYYTYKSPLLKLYRIQQEWTDTIKNFMYNDLDTAIKKSKSDLFLYLYRPADQIIIATYIKKLPLFYFTSGFSSITQVKSYKAIAVFGFLGLILAFFISMLAETWIMAKNYLNNPNTE